MFTFMFTLMKCVFNKFKEHIKKPVVVEEKCVKNADIVLSKWYTAPPLCTCNDPFGERCKYPNKEVNERWKNK